MKRFIKYVIIAIFLVGCGNQESSETVENDSSNVEIENKNTIDTEDVSQNANVENIEESTETPDKKSEFLITNEGIAGLKLGMTLDEVKSELANLTCEKVISEIDEMEFFRLKKGEDNICQFELDQGQSVMHISVGSNYKTDEGIGKFSTVAEVKKKYTVLPYKIVEGAEGFPFICLTLKEMPNIQMWLNFQVPEDYYTHEQKILASVPDDSKITDIYIERSGE